jgi:gamma-glutamylcyclotransferase
MVYYFAYASNLSHKQMMERCPGSKPKFKARLPNYKLVFTGWSRKWRGGVATIRRFGGEQVMGGVYEITERDLKKLDDYEGYPAIYGRVNVLVIPEDGDPVEAVTYIKREQSEETQPSAEYLVTLRQGYKDWGIG